MPAILQINSKALEGLLGRTLRKGEVELLLQDGVTAATERKHLNGVVGLMGLERCAMLADFVGIFLFTSGRIVTNNYPRLRKVDEKDGLKSSQWPFEPATEGIEPLLALR